MAYPMSGLQPAPMTIKFGPIAHGEPGSGDYHQIDVSQCVSMITRRAMPQGLEWAIAGIRVESNNSMNLKVMTLPQGWISANAWTAHFNAWQRQLREASEKQGHEVARASYRDFKIGFDFNDRLGTDFAVEPLLPDGFPIALYPTDTTYEWDYSRFTSPESITGVVNQHTLHMIGADGVDPSGAGNHPFGMIHNYALMRQRPMADDPNVPLGGSASKLLEIFDYGENLDTAVSNASEENNVPPYYNGKDDSEDEYYPYGENLPTGGSAAKSDALALANTSIYSSATGGGAANGFIPGFTAICGLIRLYQEAHAAQGTFHLYLDLVPGPFRGYMARRMQDVN